MPVVTLGSLLRPRLVLPLILALLLLAVGLSWLDNRDRVAWSVEVAGAAEVVDVDTDRALVRTSADELVTLERRDGSQVAAARLPEDALLDQTVLLPDGGLLASWSMSGGPYQLARYDARGSQVWQRQDRDGFRLLGVLPDLDRVAARTSGADGALLGLGLDDGETRWRRPVAADDWPTPVTTGQALLEIEVTVAPVGGGPPTAVSLADGRTTGTIDAEPAAVTDVAYWHDTAVVALADGRVLRAVDGEPADVTGLTGSAAVTFDPVEDGVVVVRGGVDEGLPFELVRGRVLPDGPEPGATLERTKAGRIERWLHGTDREDTELLSVVDADGERHGSLLVPGGEVVASAVVGDHEALVVTTDRVVLLGA